jgi:cytoskeleton protein RodZ
LNAEARAVTPSAAFECAVCGAQLDQLHVDVGDDGVRCCFCGARQDAEPVLAGASRRTARSAGVGETLRTGRMARGETLEQASRFTRIRPSYLRDLEHGDPGSFEPYPGRVYGRFFLREYASHLGLDPEPLVRRFDEAAAPAPLRLPQPTRVTRSPHPRRWAVGATLLLIALLVVGSLAARDDEEPDVGAAPTPTTPAVEGAQPSSQETATPPPADDTSVRAVIQLSRDCWILAVVDGETVLEETVPAGEKIRLRADRRMELRLGDAGAADLTVNGRSVRTGVPGAIVDLAFALRDGRVVSV